MTYLDDMREACFRQLTFQQAQAAYYLSYYDNEPPILALLDTEERQTFRKFLDESQTNWCELIVNSVAERMMVVGFNWGDSSDAAWSLWQGNRMDADGELVQTDGLVTGMGYALVQPDDDNPTGVSITPESPLEVTVMYEPGDRRERLAGYKRFTDHAQNVTEVLILPDVIATWEPGNAGEPVVEDNPAGLVGLVEVRPQPRTVGPPRSELDPAIPVVDRIHTTTFNRLVASDYGAFRQIWATGIKLARQLITSADGSTTEVAVKPWDIGANRLLVSENEAAKMGAFPGDSLTGYLAAVAEDVTHMAAITQTPAHYLVGRMVNLSADAIKAAEAGLVAKTRRRMLHVGEAWEDVIRIALGLIGDPGAANMAGEVIWRDPETRSDAQVVDALTKLATLGVPREVLWAKWGASPQEIQQWRGMADAEAATAAANQAAALGAGDIAQLIAAGSTPPAPTPASANGSANGG